MNNFSISGDATNPEDVAKVVNGTDLVVSLVGNVPGTGAYVVSETAENIINAGPKRVLFTTTIGMGGSSFIAKLVLLCCLIGRKGELSL